MDSNQQDLYAVFGVDPETARLMEKTEVLVFRISPSRYVKKTGSCTIPEDANCLKLEIYTGNRLTKSFTVYEPSTSEIVQMAHQMFGKVATSHLLDTVPSSVTQYKK